MTRENVIETLETLAMSQGSYGRLLKYLGELSEVDPGKFEEIMTGLEECKTPLDLILTIEG
jgi:hypothetical protein